MSESTSSFQPLSRAPVIAGIAGCVLILGAIILSTRNFLAFFSVEGIMIVIGGVIAVAFMSYQANDVRKALHAIKAMFREPATTHENLHHDMQQIIHWARLGRDKGMRGLETMIGKNGNVDDPFVKYGLTMVVSQYTPEEIRAMMETAADAYYERDIIPVDVLQSMASHAPAFGMVGTLVGMVVMLCNLDANVASIGSSLAVSFLSTLYGVVTARLIYMPAASKLRQKLDNIRFRHQLITEGMVMLVSNRTPTYIQDRLNSFLRPEIQDAAAILALPVKTAASARLKAITP
jgi:chemotaxis protein MotA